MEISKGKAYLMKLSCQKFKRKFPRFAKKQKVVLPMNWEKILQGIIDEVKIDNRYIIFYYESDTKILNANARWKHCIRANQWWALELIKNHDDLLLKDTFRFVIGHECAHDIYCYVYGLHTKNNQFKSYVNEIVADVYGMRLAGYNKARALEIMAMREKYSANRYVSAFSHPSAVVRTRFVERYQEVSEDMIRELADGIGCKKEKLIKFMTRKYLPYFKDNRDE